MSSRNYSASESHAYPFGGVSTFYPNCPAEQQSANYSNEVRPISLGGFGGPGTHLEEAMPTQGQIPPPPVNSCKPGRGRKKQKRKNCPPAPADPETLNADQSGVDADEQNLNDPCGMVRLPEVGSTYPGDEYQTNVVDDKFLPSDNQAKFNCNTLEQILSYKKMLLMQSPEVVEFIKKRVNIPRK